MLHGGKLCYGCGGVRRRCELKAWGLWKGGREDGNGDGGRGGGKKIS